MQALIVLPSVPSGDTEDCIEMNHRSSRFDLQLVLPGNRSRRRSK